MGSWVAEGLAAALKLPAEALILMAIPANVGQGTQIIDLQNDRRFEQRPGEFGRVMALDKATGQWALDQDNMMRVETANGFAIISAVEVRRLSGTVAVPIPDPRPSGAPPLTPSQSEDNSSTVSPAAAPVMPAPTITPIPDQRTVEDLIVEARSNAEQKRFRDSLIDEARRIDPSFDPTGYEAHHVFKLFGGSAEMQQLRADLEKLGLNLNDPANEVLLPGSKAVQDATGAYHPRLDNNEYNSAVYNELLGVPSADEARDILTRIGIKLKANDYPGIRPRIGQ